MPKIETSLQDLIGNLCEIKTEHNDLLVVARVESIDPIDNHRLNMVTVDKDERLPLLAYDTPVKVISFSGKQGFLLLRGTVFISTSSMLSLVDVHTSQGYERRKYFRLNTNTTANAVLQHEYVDEEELEENLEEDQLKITLYDISLGGMRIGSEKTLNPDDILLASFELMDKKMEFFCRICREISIKRPIPGQKQYGCEFVSFSNREIDQLCNVLFKLQRIEIQNKKKNKYD